MAGVRQEIWTGRLVEKLTQADNDSFLKDVADESRLVNNDVIHLVDVGGDPNVLVNNTTYPIPTVSQTDADIAISLDKFDSENTRVSDDELHAITYNKIDLVQRKHVRAITIKRLAKYAHALGAASNSADTPIVKTSGAVAGGAKAITIADVLSLKQAFDNLEVPEGERILVLSSEHINQLLALDQKFASQYYDTQRGQLSSILYGFKISQYVSNPHYHTDGTTGKLAFGAAPTDKHRRASIAFWTGGIFRASGSLSMYYEAANTNPERRESVVGFRMRGICLPIKQRYIGAIISVA